MGGRAGARKWEPRALRLFTDSLEVGGGGTVWRRAGLIFVLDFATNHIVVAELFCDVL